MNHQYDIIIIGAGIAGTAMARELSKYQLKIAVLDKNNDVANSTTMANSAIIHAGYDAEPYKNKGRFNAKGNAMYPKLCEELDVPFKQIGSLVIGYDEADMATLELLMERGIENDVPDMRILNREEVHAMEPNLNPDVMGALYAPTAGIVSSWEMAIALMENAMDNGVDLFLNQKVENIEKIPGKKVSDVVTDTSDKKLGDGGNKLNGMSMKMKDLSDGLSLDTSEKTRRGIGPYRYGISTDKDTFWAGLIVNCGGVYADTVHNMVSEIPMKIRPRKGEYFILDKDQGNVVNHVIFQCPSDKGKGILVTPTVHGNLLVGPDSEFVGDKGDISTDSQHLDLIRQTALRTTDQINFRKVIRTFSGLRATSSDFDFVIGEVADAPGFYNIAGFESPGLSAAPAVAEYLVSEMMSAFGPFLPNASFNPIRRPFKRFQEANRTEKQALIDENALYGRVICRCETVTEAEIIDVIHRNAGATTVKGVKKRTRAGMGRCQGGFCGPRIVEILARELDLDMTDVIYDGEEAYILTGETKQEGAVEA